MRGRLLQVLLLTAMLLIPSMAVGQTNDLIKKLESQRSALQKKLRESESLLTETKNNVASQLGELNLISARMSAQKSYIDSLSADIVRIDQELTEVNSQLHKLETELESAKKNYASSVQYLYKNRSIQEKLMFIFSAGNLSQIYRRLRYVREYAAYEQRQAQEIQRKQAQVKAKEEELMLVRKSKQEVLADLEAEREKLRTNETLQQKILKSLQSKQKTLQSEITKNRKEHSQLDDRIDKLIQEEIEKSRKAAEEEARKKAEEEKKAAAAKASAGNTASKTSQPAAAPSTAVSASKSATVSTSGMRLSSEEAILEGSFASNKGKLPIPVTGPYLIVGHYGQYNVQGLKNVTLDNKGIDIQAQDGAKARSVFDGKVVSIFQLNGLMNILIRHGSYISVYCNLSSVSVKNGDSVKARQELGTVCKDATSGRTILHFQLRKEKDKVNPEPWLAK